MSDSQRSAARLLTFIFWMWTSNFCACWNVRTDVTEYTRRNPSEAWNEIKDVRQKNNHRLVVIESQTLRRRRA